jgi:translocation and assembly module TamB
MSRRRFVVLASAMTMIAMAGAVVIAAGVLTRTELGRTQIRNFVANRVAAAINGRFYLGRISGSIFTDIIVDSVEVREENDSLLFASGRVEVQFDPRDLLDRRIRLARLSLTNPVMHLTQDSSGIFNFRRIFPVGPPALAPAQRPSRSWGDFIAVEAATIRNLTFQVTTPWEPDDTLRGTVRDSVIAFNLAREDKVIRRVGRGFTEVRRWTEGDLELGYTRLDAFNPGGRIVEVRRLSVNESDPPLRIRNARGRVRLLGDSLFADVEHFDLPRSTGSMTGRVVWGGGPTRYDLGIVGDSVSLSDIAWVYPTLPRTGGGRMKLRIVSQRDPAITDYVITDMDVRSTDSWLRGRMTFGVGAPVFIVKDVDLVAEPVDFRLIETLGGEPLPVPWRGTLTGTLRASGGPINRFRIDASNLVFRDANVPGAVAIGRASGELDILRPALAVFRGLQVDLDQLDLRTLQFLSPDFPRLNGVIAGRATLDSSWLDVRFRDADLRHSDGSGPASRFAGGGRVTFGEETTTYDVALNAAPLSFTTLARAYTAGRIPLRGEYEGPIRLQGTTSDLDLSTELRGPAGSVAYEGRVDADSAGGYGVHGALRLVSVDLRTLLDTPVTPPTQLTGRADLDVQGDSLANLLGFAVVELDRSLFDSVRVFGGSRTRIHFADQRLHVDTLSLETVAFRLRARGALGVTGSVRDSVRFEFDVDSLGGWRRYLARAPAGTGDDGVAADSLTGRVEGVGWLVGSVDTLGLRGGALVARGLYLSGQRADVVRVSADLTDLTGAVSGQVGLTLDSAVVGGARIESVDLNVDLHEGKSGEFSGFAVADNGPVVKTVGTLAFAGDTTVVGIDSLGVSMDDHRLNLGRRSSIRIEPQRVVIDTVRLVGGRGERIEVAGDIPASAPVRARISLDSIHLADISTFVQGQSGLGGTLSGVVTAGGIRSAPVLDLRGTILGATVGDVNAGRVAVAGRYENRRFVGDARVFQRDTLVMTIAANYPIDLALESRANRRLDDSMRVSARSTDVDLSLFEALTPGLRRATGRFTLNMDFAGPARAPALSGTATIVDGGAALTDLGITLRRVNVDLSARNDTLRVNAFSMQSGTENGNFLRMSGSIVRPLDPENTVYDLRVDADRFHAINRRLPGSLFVSVDGLTLQGPIASSVARGTLTVNSGSIRIPEFTGKQLFSIDDPEGLGLDSTAAANLRLLWSPPARILQGVTVQGVQVRMGEDVWLKSDEANIQLRGAVNVSVTRPFRASRPRIALDGRLTTERGTYRLNLGNIVQRTFTIEGGDLRFFDDPEFNPLLNISALYTVRQVSATYGGRNDIRIRARVVGTLARPGLIMESVDSLSISTSDMLSYLVAGVPSLGIGDVAQNTELASAIALGTFSSLVSSWWSGGLFDYVQIQTASDRFRFGATTGEQRSQNLFEGAQLGVGRQLTDRTFVSLTTGLCFLGGGGSARQTDPVSIASSFGVKVEHQWNLGYGVAASIEPPLNALLCTGAQDPGLSTSRRQLGLDFFRVWRF